MSVTIHVGDCLEILPGLPRSSVDVMSNEDPDPTKVWYFPSNEAEELWEKLGRVLGRIQTPEEHAQGTE